jgi:hypothetical protein
VSVAQTLNIRRFHGTGGVRLWFSGVIDEHFPADAFENTHGVIVVDLGGVRRITSFGIREWCRALTTIDTSRLYFAEVADCMVPQFAMVAGFSGGGQILSYQQPYECDECGASEKRSFDRRWDPDAMWNGEPPEAPCKSCGKVMHFVDISESTRIALMTSTGTAARSVLAAAPHARSQTMFSCNRSTRCPAHRRRRG